MGFTTKEILEHLGQGKDLSKEMALMAFSMLADGEFTPAQGGALLMGLRVKGETPVEINAAVKALLDRAVRVTDMPAKTFEAVGTGGDNSSSFNCSTATSITLAGMGYAVTKHGNRSVSSKCGAADAVEGLGLPIYAEPDQIRAELAKRNFVFLFAPNFHPAFRHIMPTRKDLAIRTLFNLLGPLLNPSRPSHQLIGVAKPEVMELMAEVLLLGGVERAAVVHGAGGLDELTPWGPAQVIWVADGKLLRTELDPAELGIQSCTIEDVAVTGKEHGLEVFKQLLAGQGPKGMQEMLVFNLAVGIHLLEPEVGMQKCVERARAALAQGAGLKVLADG